MEGALIRDIPSHRRLTVDLPANCQIRGRSSPVLQEKANVLHAHNSLPLSVATVRQQRRGLLRLTR